MPESKSTLKWAFCIYRRQVTVMDFDADNNFADYSDILGYTPPKPVLRCLDAGVWYDDLERIIEECDGPDYDFELIKVEE